MQIDVYDLREKALTVVVASLFVLFVVMLPRYTDIAKTWFMLLILAALGYLVFNFKQVKFTNMLERLLFAAIIMNFLWIAFTFYANGEPGRGASFVWSRHFYFLFFIPLFFLFRRIEIPDRVIVLALFCSIVVSLIDILIDLVQGIDHRLQGMNVNAFGPIQVCLSGILLFYFIKRPETLLRWVALAGCFFGIANVVFSESRGTWMTLTVLSIFFAIYLARSQPAWKKTALVAVIMLLISSSYFLPIVKGGIDYAIRDVSSYFGGEHNQKSSSLSSIGQRIELLKTGWYIFLENPLLGVGVGGFKSAAQANSERYQVNEIVHQYKNPHNQYIAALATRGIPGLALLLMVLLIPLYIAMSHKSFNRDTEIARLSIIFICLTYVIGNIAENHFEGKSATMFVGTFLPLLLAKISSDRPN